MSAGPGTCTNRAVPLGSRLGHPCAPPADVLFTWGGECLVQEGVLTAMEHARLTGFWIRPAKARMKKTGEPVPIRQLHVSGWGGVAPPESGIRRVKYCAGCQSSHYSDITNPEHLIDSRNWDGSDFFKIWPLLGFVFVTERVQQIFKVNGFKGARFLKTFPTGAVTAAHGLGYGPPPLRWTFPDDRAHEIGDPLGIY